MKKYILKTYGGDTFTEVAQQAKLLTAEKGVVQFEFNGVECIVDANTNLDWLWRDYLHAHLMDWKEVGPDCPELYSTELAQEIRKKKLEQEEEARVREEEWRKKDALERAAFAEKTNDIEIELSDPEGWKKFKESNTDPYGACCVEYAEGWAKLMQAEFAKGKKIADCAKETSFQLGFLGITGFMYGCAVSMLAKCWKHGEALRMWHNLDTQIGSEGEAANESGGVLNPALLNIG